MGLPDTRDLRSARGKVVGCWFWDVSADRFYADRELAPYFGMTPEEAAVGPSSKTFGSAIFSEDLEGLRRGKQASLEHGVPLNEVYRLRTKCHGLRWVLSLGQCFHDANGQPTVFFGHITDLGSAVSASPGIVMLHHQICAAKAKAHQSGLDFAEYVLEMLAEELKSHAAADAGQEG